MGKYDLRLAQLIQSDIIARLEGPGGLLALSNRELFYLDDRTHQSARLAHIKRISVNKQTGTVDVMGEQGLLMAIAPTAFQKNELKLFLESLKEHVLKAKSEAIQADQPAQVVESAETPPAMAPHKDASSLSSTPTPQPTYPTPQGSLPATAKADTSPSSSHFNIADPAKTLPDEPKDSIWAYDGSPQPGEATAAPKPTPAPSPQGQVTLPPSAAAPARSLGPTQRIISVLLKVSALITAVITGGYLVVNMGITSDIWVPLGVIAVGLSLALIQWRLSEPY